MNAARRAEMNTSIDADAHIVTDIATASDAAIDTAIDTRARALAEIDATLTAIGKVARSRRAAELRQRRAGVKLADTAIAALAAVYRYGPVRIGEVAAHMDLDASRASKEIRRLVEDGYVIQKIDPQERRASSLTVTAKGRRAFERYRAAADALVVDVFAPWSADLAAAAGVLRRLTTSFIGGTTSTDAVRGPR